MGRFLGTAMLIGAGVLAVAAIVAAPRLLQAARPTLREGLKRGMGFYERARSAVAEVVEDVEDLVAEVRAEIDTGVAGKAQSASESADA